MRDWYAALTPRAKLDHVSALQARGERVAVVGDGVNDAPILAKADVSFAVADSSAAARQQADILLLRPDLLLIARVFESARAWKRVAKQNSMWALAYNGLAIPAAACGLLPPWLAALGMSVSSLIVVVNALRLCGTRCSWT
jgi:Cu2+-exporting ATPase